MDSLIRTSLHLSRQKFEKIEAGLSLSLTENKALFALQKLLDKTNYKGNIDGRNATPENSFRYNGFLPRIQFTPAEFLEAYGLKRTMTGRGYQEFNNNERNEAMKALRALADRKFKILYERKRWDKKGKDVTDVIITESSLIQIIWGLIGLTAEEKKKWDDGRFSENELMDRSTVAVEFAPILVDQIDGYFILIPSSFYEDIKAQVPAAKYSQYIPMFLEWLILQAEIQRRAKTGWKIEINYKKLAEKLGMGKLIKQRKSKEIQANLQECYDIAIKLGYIDKASTEEGRYASKEVIYLNKERFGKDKIALALPK
jgi:hypothetical protein